MMAMEDETDPRTSVRRVRTEDRKTALPPAGPLFTDAPGADSEAIAAPSRPRTQSRRKDVARGKSPRRRVKNAALYNLITLLFVLLTAAVVVYFAFLWENFSSPLNPFAPPTPLPIIVTATPGG